MSRVAARIKIARNRLSLTLLAAAKYLTLAAVAVRARKPAPRTEDEIMERAAQIVNRKMQSAQSIQIEATRDLVTILTALRGAHGEEDEATSIAMHEVAEDVIQGMSQPKALILLNQLSHFTAYHMPEADLQDIAKSLMEYDSE